MLSIDKGSKVLSRENGGYFTAEATMIAALCCFIVLCVMVGAVYYYDLGVASSYIREEAADITMTAGAEPERTSESYMKELQGKMVMAQVVHCSISKKNEFIIGNAELTVRFPIPVAGAWIGKVWKNEISVRFEQGNVPEKIRRWYLLE